MKGYRIWRVRLAEDDKVIRDEIFARRIDARDFARYAEKEYPQATIYIEKLEPFSKTYQRMVAIDRDLFYEPPF